MSILGFLRPLDSIAESERQAGLRRLIVDGACAQVLGVLTSGAFLIAFALSMGASNKAIGLIAAIPPLCQTLQLPAIVLVERLKWRKALTVFCALPARLSWLGIAALPLLAPAELRIPLLCLLLVLFFGLANISGCAWNAWMRDFIPEEVMGSYFGRRLAIMTTLGAVLTVLAGLGVDWQEERRPDWPYTYSLLFVFASLVGSAGIPFLARVAEPRMPEAGAASLLAMLKAPFLDGNFRALILFLGLWNFSINLAAPFFVVYMLQRLELSMGLVLGLSVLSQAMNALFFTIWGRIADVLSNKSVLSLSAFIFLLCVALFPFTTLPDKHVFTIPLLVAIHVLAGIGAAGMALCSGNMALKFSPRGKAAGYLATNALVVGLAATLAPILSGFGADWFARQSLTLDLTWTVTGLGDFNLPALDFRGLDFIFAITVVFGLYSLHRLAAVREEGEVEEKIVLNRMYSELRMTARHASNIGGMRQIVFIPLSLAQWTRRQSRQLRNGKNGKPNGNPPPDPDATGNDTGESGDEFIP